MMRAENFLTFGMMLTLFVVIGCSQNSDAPSKSTTGNSSGATESVPAASKPSSADNETADSAQDKPSAESIIDAHIRAVGGAEAIARIKTIHRTGTISGQSSFGPLSGTVEEIFDLSKNRGYTSMELTGYSRKTGWTGDSGWVSDTQAGVTEMPADEAAFANYIGGPSPLAAIHADQGFAALKEVGEKEFNGKKCAVVSVDETIEFFVNQETNLLEGMTIPKHHNDLRGLQSGGRPPIPRQADDEDRGPEVDDGLRVQDDQRQRQDRRGEVRKTVRFICNSSR